MEPTIIVTSEGAQGIKDSLSCQSKDAIKNYLEKLDAIGKAQIELKELLNKVTECPDMGSICSSITNFTKLVNEADTQFKSYRECDVSLDQPIPCVVNDCGVQSYGQIVGLSPVGITFYGGNGNANVNKNTNTNKNKNTSTSTSTSTSTNTKKVGYGALHIGKYKK